MIVSRKVIPAIRYKGRIPEGKKTSPEERPEQFPTLCHLRARRAALRWGDCATGNSLGLQKSGFRPKADAEPPSAPAVIRVIGNSGFPK